MDWIRGTYRSKMKLWDNDDTETEVLWFIPEPNALIYTDICSFRSRHTWQRGEVVEGVGEVTGRRYPYTPGQNTLDYPGDHFCGAADAFFGGGVHGRDEEITTEEDGSTPCCFPPVIPPTVYHDCAPYTGYTEDGALWAYSSDVVQIGLVGFLVVHRAAVTPSTVAVPGWSLEYDQLFTPATDPFFTGKHRVSVYRRVFDGSEPGTDLAYPATPGEQGQIGAIMISAGPAQLHLKSVTATQALGGTMHLPRPTAVGGELYLGRWMALSNASYSGANPGQPSPICFVSNTVKPGQVWNPHVGLRDRSIQEIADPGITPDYSVAQATGFGDSVVLIVALFGV